MIISSFRRLASNLVPAPHVHVPFSIAPSSRRLPRTDSPTSAASCACSRQREVSLRFCLDVVVHCLQKAMAGFGGARLCQLLLVLLIQPNIRFDFLFVLARPSLAIAKEMLIEVAPIVILSFLYTPSDILNHCLINFHAHRPRPAAHYAARRSTMSSCNSLMDQPEAALQREAKQKDRFNSFQRRNRLPTSLSNQTHNALRFTSKACPTLGIRYTSNPTPTTLPASPTRTESPCPREPL